MRRRSPTEWPYGRLYGPPRGFEELFITERLKGRLTGILERFPVGLAPAAAAQKPDANLESEIHPEIRRAGPCCRDGPALRGSKTQKEQENV